MPRCFPEDPDFTDRTAERVVWLALAEQLPAEAALFHSVAFTDENGESEADLIIGWPGAGVAVIEVKGGHVAVTGGRWQQSGATGTHRIDPVSQAQRSKHALLDYLRARTSWGGQGLKSAHLIATPYSHFPATFTSPDCKRLMLIDKDDLPTSASRVREALNAFGGTRRTPDALDIDRLIDALAVTMPTQLSLLSALAEETSHVELMTKDQSRILSMLAYQTRMVVTGGAGSGKTFLALEQARRRVRAGDRVALTCYSRGLARFFQRMTARWPKKEQPAYVGTFHGLALAWDAPAGADDDSAYWEEQLPAALQVLAGERQVADRFDSIVVDEAQDFGESWWPALEACLKDRGTGGLFVFLDEAQRVFMRHAEIPIDTPPFPLNENLRNTKRIAQTFGSLTATQMKARGKPGVPVRFVPCSAEEAVGCADDAVDGLLEEGWPAGEIALLTTHHKHPEHTHRVAMRGLEGYWDDFFVDDELFYGHVLGFKGLERGAVVLAVNGFRQAERAKEMLYVGLSRPRSLLVVCGDLDMITQVGGRGVRSRLSG